MSVEEMPLLDRIDDINNPHSNFIEIFGINTSDGTSDGVKATIRNLHRLLLTYHPDYCSELKGYTTEEREKCVVISQKIIKIMERLQNDNNYDFLKQLSLPQTKSVKDSLEDVTDPPNSEKKRKFYVNLLNQQKILDLARQILTALKVKYSSFDFTDTSFQSILETIAKNITLSFFDDTYHLDSLREQILAFIEKSEELSNGKYKLHDIIDFLGNDRKKLGHDYCVALNIFYNLMIKVFGYDSVEPAPTFGFSSFYKHKDRCMDPSYSPEPTKGSGLSFKNTRVSELFKFKKLQNELNIDELKESIHIPSFTDAEDELAAEAEGGSKSRRRHRRKPARKTRRGRTRKSKSKSKTKTHRHRRHSRIRKHKKNTYTRRR